MSTAPTILIVEDEEKIAGILRDYLKADGFATHWINNGSDVCDWVKRERPQLVLLDIMLPGLDGISVCRELRRTTDVPIVMVTARVEEIDRLLGLELGADDYICKPFSPREVVARVKVILRRVQTVSGGSPDEYRGIRIDEERFSASVGEQMLQLTPVEFRLLKRLLGAPGRVYSRDELIRSVYVDGRVVSGRTIDSHVKNLRQKVESAGSAGDVIHSIYGVGYKLE